MPIPYRIDDDRRRVIAEPAGELTTQDLFDYQREVWSRPELAGYDELVDMSRVEKVEFESSFKMRELARLSAKMNHSELRTRMAIVAAKDLHYGLGRMYEAYRAMAPGSTREVRTFRHAEEALAWLDERPATTS